MWVAIGVVSALLASGCAGSGVTTPAPSPSSSSTATTFGLAQQSPPTAAAGPVSLPDLAQVDLTTDGAVSVRLNGYSGWHATLSASYGTQSGTSRPLGNISAQISSAHQLIRVPIGASARSALSLCIKRTIVVHASLTRGGQSSKQGTSGALFLHPPKCVQFFAANSVWNTALPAGMPIDPTSRALVATLNQDVVAHGSFLNTTSYSTPIYTVSADQPRVPYVINSTSSVVGRVRQEFVGGVPIPAGAHPSLGTDGQMTIWQPATDTLWELYQAQRVGGAWHGHWGAVMPQVSRNPGVFPRLPGGVFISTTASGLPLVGGLITLADLRRGRIDHALQLGIPETRRSVSSRPATTTDGVNAGPGSIPEGARFRLPASLNVASLHLPPLARMLAAAAQRYGVVVIDQSGSVAFRGQDPLGSNAWARALGGRSTASVIGQFPWRQLELVQTAPNQVQAGHPYRLPAAHPTQTLNELRAPPQCYLYGIPCS